MNNYARSKTLLAFKFLRMPFRICYWRDAKGKRWQGYMVLIYKDRGIAAQVRMNSLAKSPEAFKEECLDHLRHRFGKDRKRFVKDLNEFLALIEQRG